ncbi:MAG: hypothetical protein AAF900_00735 [Bacteroidota bacterium]
MRINYLKNKKYHILISLLCLCYALGLQKVKAATLQKLYNPIDNTAQPVSSELIYDLSSDDSPVYKIADFKDICEFYTYDDRKNIALFVGKSAQKDQDGQNDSQSQPAQLYIFITHNSFPKTSEQGKIRVTGFPVSNRDNISSIAQRSNDIKATLAASSISLQEAAFIFSCEDINLTFYYCRGLLSDKFMEANAVDSNFYREKSKDSSKPIQVWEVALEAPLEMQEKGQIKDIVATWELYLEDIHKIEKPSSKGWLYRRLELSDRDARRYIQLNEHTINCIVFFIIYCIFHKAINEKVSLFVHEYILRKK